MTKTYRSIKSKHQARTSNVAMQAPAAMGLLRVTGWGLVAVVAFVFINNYMSSGGSLPPLATLLSLGPEAEENVAQTQDPTNVVPLRDDTAIVGVGGPTPVPARTLTWVRDLDVDQNVALAEYYSRYGVGESSVKAETGVWNYYLPNGSVTVLPSNWSARDEEAKTRVLIAIYDYVYELGEVDTWWLW